MKLSLDLVYGGQFFNKTIIPKISNTLNFFKKNKHKVKIEVDGGLTTEIIDQLNEVGVDYFAGWSIVKGKNLKEISLKLDNLKKTRRIDTCNFTPLFCSCFNLK